MQSVELISELKELLMGTDKNSPEKRKSFVQENPHLFKGRLATGFSGRMFGSFEGKNNKSTYSSLIYRLYSYLLDKETRPMKEDELMKDLRYYSQSRYDFFDVSDIDRLIDSYQNSFLTYFFDHDNKEIDICRDPGYKVKYKDFFSWISFDHHEQYFLKFVGNSYLLPYTTLLPLIDVMEMKDRHTEYIRFYTGDKTVYFGVDQFFLNSHIYGNAMKKVYPHLGLDPESDFLPLLEIIDKSRSYLDFSNWRFKKVPLMRLLTGHE